jgi:hypothetical protein
MIINVAEGVVLDEITINSKVGNITVDGVSVASLDVISVFGNVSVQNLPNPATKINCRGRKTDIVLDKSFYSSCSLTTKIGTVQAHVLDLNNFSTVAETWIGDISIETDVPTKEYKLKLSSTKGSVIHNGKNVGGELENLALNATRITASSLFGDLGIRFTGGDEDKYVSAETAPAPEETPQTEQASQPEGEAPAA